MQEMLVFWWYKFPHALHRPVMNFVKNSNMFKFVCKQNQGNHWNNLILHLLLEIPSQFFKVSWQNTLFYVLCSIKKAKRFCARSYDSCYFQDRTQVREGEYFPCPGNFNKMSPTQLRRTILLNYASIKWTTFSVCIILNKISQAYWGTYISISDFKVLDDSYQKTKTKFKHVDGKNVPNLQDSTDNLMQ